MHAKCDEAVALRRWNMLKLSHRSIRAERDDSQMCSLEEMDFDTPEVMTVDQECVSCVSSVSLYQHLDSECSEFHTRAVNFGSSGERRKELLESVPFAMADKSECLGL